MGKKQALDHWKPASDSSIHQLLEKESKSDPDTSQNELLSLAYKLVDCQNALLQVSLVKQMSENLQRSRDSELQQAGLVIHLFVNMFLNVKLKSPLKKTIASALQELDDPMSGLAVSCLQKEFHSMISTYNTKLSHELFKQIVDNVIASLDNFSCVLHFFVNGLSFLNNQLMLDLKPQELNEIFSLYQVTLKALLMTLPLWEKCNTTDEHITFLRDIYQAIHHLLTQENTLLNIQTSGSIAFVMICRCFTGTFENCLEFLLTSDLKSPPSHEPRNPLSLGVAAPADYFSGFPDNSKLCMLAGIMAVFNSDQLFHAKLADGRNFLLDVILPEILTLYSAVDHSRILCCSRTLLLWTEKVCEGIQNGNSQDALLQRLNYDSKAVQQILSYVYNHWEHFIDTVCYQAQDILRNTLLIHSSSSSKDGASKEFMMKLCHSLLMLPWHQRGKYRALQCVVKYMRCSEILNIEPSLPFSILQASKESCLACHIGELYEALYQSHRDECSLEVWQCTWLHPLLCVLIGSSKAQRLCIHLYILPTLLKLYPDSLKYFTSKLLNDFKGSDNSLGALLTCLRIANTLGLLSSFSSSAGPHHMTYKWEEVIPVQTLKAALCSLHDEIRLDALSLLCNSPKSKEPLSTWHLDIMSDCLCFNLYSQSPAFRQQMLAHFKKFIARLIETFSVSERSKKQPHSRGEIDAGKLRALEELRDAVKNFVFSMGEFLFSCVNVRCNFPCRCTALQLLCVMKETFQLTLEKESQHIPQCEHIITLVHCLRDTYENNKKLALELLSFFRCDSYFMDECVLENHVQAAMDLAFSIRPPDSVTAAYLFQFLVKFTATQKICQHHCEEISLSESSNYHPSDISFSVIQLLLYKFEANMENSLCEREKPLLSRKPLFGLLTCIRALLLDVNMRHIPPSHVEKWRNLLAKLIELCFKAIHLVMDVVCGSSCEEHFDNGEILTPYKFEPFCEGELFSGLHSLSSSKTEIEANDIKEQVTLLFSWRMHKEVSLILGMIGQNAEIGEAPLEGGALLSTRQVREIGKFFISQMSQVTHRGAFEQAYLGFCQICHTMWRSRVGDLHLLPQQWLNDLVGEISGKSKAATRFCATRRSAGVPFMVQALVTTEPDVRKSACFSKAMALLTDVALTYGHKEKSGTDPQVHAMNVLRALYRDTRLGEMAMRFIADGIKAAVCGFRAPSWAVRNSATLLFSSLMTRIFGVARSRDEAQRKNTMTGRLFFMRFPSLYEFLLDELEAATKAIASKQVHQSLYPSLLLLARLHPSVMEGTDSSLKLDAFLPYLEQCAYSSIWKTRVLAAQAIIPLLDNRVQHLKKLLAMLTSGTSPPDQLPSNKIHGILLQILYMVQGYPDLHPNVQKEMRQFLEELVRNSFDTLVLSFMCLANQAVHLNIVQLLLQMEVLHINNAPDSDHYFFRKCVSNLLEPESGHRVFSEAYRTQLTCLLLHACSQSSQRVLGGLVADFPSLVVYLLKSDVYEMRACTLGFLKVSLFKESTLDEYFTTDFVLGVRKWKNSTSSLKISPGIVRDLLQSKTLAQYLIEMAVGLESDPGCLTLLFQVMSAFPVIAEADWELPNGCALGITEKLKLMLDRLATVRQVDLMCSILHFSGHLCEFVYHRCIQGDEALQKQKGVLERWVEALEENCLSECSEGQRKAAVLALKHVGSDLFLDQRSLLGGVQVARLWRSLIALLQDDERSVREQAVQVVAQIQQLLGTPEQGAKPSLLQFTVPSLALDVAIGIFFEHVMPKHPKESFLSALQWLLSCDESCQKGERPFEKSEMNSYAEEVILTCTVARHLSTAIMDGKLTGALILSSSELQDWLDELFFASLGSDVDLSQMCVCILRQTEAFVAYIQQGDGALPFTDKNCILQEMKLYKHLALLLCMSHFQWFQESPALQKTLTKVLHVIQSGGLKFGSTFQLLKLVLDNRIL